MECNTIYELRRKRAQDAITLLVLTMAKKENPHTHVMLIQLLNELYENVPVGSWSGLVADLNYFKPNSFKSYDKTNVTYMCGFSLRDT